MKVLVTGITGRIGSQLADTLLSQGYEVIGFTLPNDPAKSFWEERGISIFEGKLEEFDSVVPAVKAADAIAHMGALMSWDPNDNPALFEINVRGTTNLLEAVAKTKDSLHRFVLASSGQIYPDNAPFYRPVDEFHPRQPYSFYGLTKQLSEDVCAFYHRNNDIPTVVARFSPTFKAREMLDPEGPHTAHRFFLRQKIKKLTAQYEASPSQALRHSISILKARQTEEDQLVLTRDEQGFPPEMAISDARDTAAGIILMLEKQAAIGETFNLGPETSWSFETIIRYMAKLTGFPVVDAELPLPRLKLQNSIAKARTLLGYRPSYSVFDMIEESYRYWESKKRAGSGS